MDMFTLLLSIMIDNNRYITVIKIKTAIAKRIPAIMISIINTGVNAGLMPDLEMVDANSSFVNFIAESEKIVL